MDLFDLDMSAARDAESFRLAGTKRYVAGAREASRMLVVARTGPEGEGDRKQGLSLFSVDPQQQGIAMVARELSVRVTADEELVLITGDTFFDVAFDDLELSRGDLVGEEGLGADAVIDASNLLFILTAVTAIGWGESVLEKAIEHAKTRAVFEDPIGSYQAIQHPMVRAKTELELAKLAIARAVSAYDKRDADLAVYASVAKCAATEAAYCACDISLQALGGGGFDRETGVITLWPLILLSRILPLNNEVILERFAEAALDLPVGVGA
jgi:alkylation response protein AidB-like acyl-CoA dehydrogenase